MFRSIYVTCLLFAFAPRAHACESFLSFAATIPRLDLEDLKLDSAALVVGDDALDARTPARVVTLRGGDRLLAVDARAALDAGLDHFFDAVLAVPDSAAGHAWRAAVRTHLSTYARVAKPAADWRAWWRSPEHLAAVDEIFFLRVFGPNEGDRLLALISLRPPATEPLGTHSLPPPRPLLGNRFEMPDRVWESLRPNGQQNRYLIWDVPGQKGYVADRRLSKYWFLEHLDGTAEFQRVLHGGDVITLAGSALYARRGKGGAHYALVYQARFEDLPGHQIIRVTREFESTMSEILALNEAATQRRLEPARVIDPDRRAGRPVAISIPDYLTQIPTEEPLNLKTIVNDVSRTLRDPRMREARDAVFGLRDGERVLVIGRDEPNGLANTPGCRTVERMCHGRTFVFTRAGETLYLTAYLKSTRL